MIVNSTLAKGAVDMSRKRCIMKQLDAIVIMGAVNVLCTDKTGTLTKSEVTLLKYLNSKGIPAPLPLLMGYLNARFQSCHENPLDAAIKQFYEENQNMLRESVADQLKLIDEIPFDFSRRRLSVVVEDLKTRVVICKGAVDEILQVCTSVTNQALETSQVWEQCIHKSENVQEMTPELLKDLEAIYEQLSKDGLRVIGVAYKIVSEELNEFGVQDEVEMVFVGFLAFMDPPKETAREAIEKLVQYNVDVKVLTGDSPLICQNICREIGLTAGMVITGQEIAKALEGNDTKSRMEKMRKIANEYGIFAKLTPIQKSEIVKALKLEGNVVGFLGDGINDAPALSEADVGISVDTGMDVCKESADMILLEKDLRVIVDGVLTGRRTYGNMLKYIVMGMASNFGNVFSILIASAWLPFEPMQSLHILIQNLLYDASQFGIPWDNVDSEFLSLPQNWSMRRMVKFMVMIGPWSSLFDVATFLFLYYYFGIQVDSDYQKVKVFQSCWFCLGMVTQTLLVHLIRTPKIPFVESRPSWQMTGMTLIILGIGLSLPYIPGLNGWLHLVQLPWEMFPFLGAVIIAYSIIIQFSKYLFQKIFNEWY